MSYICKPILPVSTTDAPPSFSNMGLGAVRGVFVLLILTVWLTLAAAMIWSVLTLLKGLNGGTLFELVIGLITIATIIWAFFPRLDTPPPTELCINKDEFPALYGMVAQVASALNIPMPRLVLTEQYTASFGRFGWQQTPVLFLGHGLLSIVSRTEMTMLLAHELYHVYNSGWTHTRVVKITAGGVYNLLWLLSLQPLRKWEGVPRPLQLPLAPLMLLMYLFRWCTAYEMRHIEVEADEAALLFSPSHVMESLMRKTALRHVPPVQNAYIGASAENKYAAIRAASDEVDPIQFGKLWQAVLQTQLGPFDRHPTVAQRIAMAREQGQQRVRPLLTMHTYSLAHQELKRWPLWLDAIEKRVKRLELS